MNFFPKKSSLKLYLAFSLIEIMIGLIIMSVLISVFAPVLTKKINGSAVVVPESAVNKIGNQTILDTNEGCIVLRNDGNNGVYLHCPFKVPKEVSKIGFVMVVSENKVKNDNVQTVRRVPKIDNLNNEAD